MITRFATLPVLATLALVVAGCGREEPAPPATPVAPAAAEHADDHGPTDAHTGEPHNLGTTTIGGYDVAVTQIGDVHAGEGATFEIRATPDADISAVRAWVGVESGQGSLKVLAPKRGDFYDADLEVPAQLAEDSRVWVELETASGRNAGSFNLAQE